MLKVQLWLGKHFNIGAVLLKALLGKFTCGIPARMQKLGIWRPFLRNVSVFRKWLEPNQASFSSSTLCILLLLAMKSRLFSRAVFSTSREEIWHQPLWLLVINSSLWVLVGDPRLWSVVQGGEMVGTAMKTLNPSKKQIIALEVNFTFCTIFGLSLCLSKNPIISATARQTHVLWLGQPACAGSLWIFFFSLFALLAIPSVSWHLVLCTKTQPGLSVAPAALAKPCDLLWALKQHLKPSSIPDCFPILQTDPAPQGFGFSASPPLGLLSLLRGSSERVLKLAVGQAVKHWRPTAHNLCNTLLILVWDMARADDPQGRDVCSQLRAAHDIWFLKHPPSFAFSSLRVITWGITHPGHAKEEDLPPDLDPPAAWISEQPHSPPLGFYLQCLIHFPVPGWRESRERVEQAGRAGAAWAQSFGCGLGAQGCCSDLGMEELWSGCSETATAGSADLLSAFYS